MSNHPLFHPQVNSLQNELTQEKYATGQPRVNEMANFQPNLMDEYVPMHQSMHYAHVPQMAQRESPMSREPKGKRKQVGRACAQCAAAHVACSEHRPCTRCSKRGIPCQDRERKRRRRLEHDEDGGDDPMIATAGFMIPSHGSLGPMYLPPMGHFPGDYSFPEYFGHKTFGGFDDKMPRGFPFNEPGAKQEEMYAVHPDFHLQAYYPHHPHEEYPPLPAGYPYGFQSHFHHLPHPPYEEEPISGQVLQSTNEKFPQTSYGVPSFTGFPQFENLNLPTALPATLPAPLLPSVTQGLPQTLSPGLAPQGLGAQVLASPSLAAQGLSPSLSAQGLGTPTLGTQGLSSQAPPAPVSPPKQEESQTSFKAERELTLPPLATDASDARSS